MEEGVVYARQCEYTEAVVIQLQEVNRSDAQIADVLRGYFATALMTGDPRSIDALAKSAELDGKDPETVILENIPLITKIRTEHPELNETKGSIIGGRQARPIDMGLEPYGILWSPSVNAYVSIR